ncbi:MAG: hypothetical protein F6K35_44580 [Okeania sp. SIO2H7]|nr:hypothetical protein [Okeania sp. SIO2H7]
MLLNLEKNLILNPKPTCRGNSIRATNAIEAHKFIDIFEFSNNPPPECCCPYKFLMTKLTDSRLRRVNRRVTPR